MLGKCRPKAYSTLYSAMLSIKSCLGGWWGVFQGSSCSETGWALVCLWEVEKDCHCITCFFNLFPSLIKLTPSLPMSFLTFALILSPVPLGLGMSKQLYTCFIAGQDQATKNVEGWNRKKSVMCST